jgi:hypothetical protein
MKPYFRKPILSFFLNGTTFTLIMIAFQYATDDIQKWWQYALQFVLFGATMAFVSYRSWKKHDAESNS